MNLPRFYAVAQVAYKDQVACLSTPKEPGACALKVTDGGVYRIVGRKAPLKIKRAAAAVLAASAAAFVASGGWKRRTWEYGPRTTRGYAGLPPILSPIARICCERP